MLGLIVPLFSTVRTGAKEETLLALRIMADTMGLEHLRQLTGILLGGAATSGFNRCEWLQVVRDSLDHSPLTIRTRGTCGCSSKLLQGLITISISPPTRACPSV